MAKKEETEQLTPQQEKMKALQAALARDSRRRLGTVIAKTKKYHKYG